MKKSDKTDRTKKAILEAARKLYYEYGYDEISFEEIAKHCGITKPLISYHFSSKSALGGQIFGTYSKENSNVFFEKAYAAGCTDKQVIGAAFSIQCIKYYKEDANALRFFSQYFSSCGFLPTPEIEDFWTFALHNIKTSESTEVSHMKYTFTQYGSRALIHHYANGDIKCEPEEIYRFLISMLPGFETDEAGFDILFDKTMDLLDKISIEYLPNFDWS